MCILIVEDDPIIREMTGLLLEEAGHEVILARDGQEACKYIENLTGYFSCLVTDYSMPGGITGAEVITRMRIFYPMIPIILMSAYPYAVTQHWRETNHVELFSKPYDPAKLAKRLVSLPL